MNNTKINWNKISYISYDWKNDTCLSDDEKAEIAKAYEELANTNPNTDRYKYLDKKIKEKQNFTYND